MKWKNTNSHSTDRRSRAGLAPARQPSPEYAGDMMNKQPKRLMIAGLCFAMIVWACCIYTVCADTIILKNGRLIKGQIISQDAQEIHIRVQEYGIENTLILRRKYVRKIVITKTRQQNSSGGVSALQTNEPQGISADTITAEYELRRQKIRRLDDQQEKARRLAKLGRWAVSQGMIVAGLQAYQESLTYDQSQSGTIGMEAARIAMQYQLCDWTRRFLEQILRQSPNHVQAHALMSQLNKCDREKIASEMRHALKIYRQHAYRQALLRLVKVVRGATPAQLRQSEHLCQRITGQTLARVMVDCRLHQPCRQRGCHRGWIKCPNPNCHNGKERCFRRPIETNTGRVINRVVVWKLCPRCQGARYLPCPVCGGTGADLGRPTSYEKPELLKRLGILVDQGLRQARLFANQAIRGQAQLARAQQVLAQTCATKHYLQIMLRLDPSTASPWRGGRREQLKELCQLRLRIMQSMAGHYYQAAVHLYDKAIDFKYRQKRSERLAKLQKSMAEAESARVMALYALQADPSLASVFKGDLQGLLTDISKHIRRCRRAYYTLWRRKK